MSKLSSLWTSSRLSLALKMRLYNSLIISIITYGSASWRLTIAQKKRIDAVNTKALRGIVCVRWYDYATNASILLRTGQPPLTTTIRKLRLSAFGHICRLQPGTQAIDILTSTPPSTWHHPRGRPATKSSKTPRCPWVMPWQQCMIEHLGDHSFVMLRILIKLVLDTFKESLFAWNHLLSLSNSNDIVSHTPFK